MNSGGVPATSLAPKKPSLSIDSRGTHARGGRFFGDSRASVRDSIIRGNAAGVDPKRACEYLRIHAHVWSLERESEPRLRPHHDPTPSGGPLVRPELNIIRSPAPSPIQCWHLMSAGPSQTGPGAVRLLTCSSTDAVAVQAGHASFELEFRPRRYLCDLKSRKSIG